MTHNSQPDPDKIPTGELPIFLENQEAPTEPAVLADNEPETTTKRRSFGKGVWIPAALAGFATAVAGAVYLSEDEPATPKADPTPVATAEPSPTPTEERTIPRPTARPTETAAPALPETPAELQEIAAASLEEFRYMPFENKLGFYNWLEEKYELDIPNESSVDPTEFNEDDPLIEVSYVINDAVPRILEQTNSEEAKLDAQKITSFVLTPVQPDELLYPEELEQWHDEIVEHIAQGETLPFEYMIEETVIHNTDYGMVVEVITETDGEVMAYGLRRLAIPDENDPDVYHGRFRLVGMGEPTDKEVEEPQETTEPSGDMAAYESLSADEFLNTVDETIRPAYGEYLLNKHGLELPYQIPESVNEVSPQGLIDNYNFIMESVPLIYDEDGVEEAKKLLWSLFSPQPGDVIDSESQPHNVSWEAEFRIFEQLNDDSFADPNSRLRQRWSENERRELSRPDLGLNPQIRYDGYEIWTGVEGYAQSTERTDLWRFVPDGSGQVHAILVGINEYKAIIDPVM